MTATTTAPKPATAKQLTLITRLAAERGVTDNFDTARIAHYTTRQASAAIDALFGMPKIPAAPAAPAAPAITDGMYLMDGVVYKVQVAVHGSGNLYAKRLEVEEALDADGETVARGRFEYAPGVVRDLRPEHRMTLEQAKQFGALYGVCCRCGRTLTNEDSIEAAMGPICRGKF
jgi:hypothetical protein